MSGSFPNPGGTQSLENFQFSFERQLEDSDLENSGNMSDTESLTESVIAVQEENGRTYHSFRAGSYVYPNDDQENDRLDLQYECISCMFEGRLFHAPWTKDYYPLTVLDIGTGTGKWVIEMGDKFPQSRIRGIDLSPIQPTWAPPNVEFLIEDATLPWQPTLYYDYIHTRLTLGCWANFSSDICRQAYAQLNPGGWFESAELDPRIYCDDGTMPSTYEPYLWLEETAKIAAEAQRPILFAQTLKQSYERAGFSNVQEVVYRVPLNDWGCAGNLSPLERKVGAMWEENMVEGMSAFSLALWCRYRKKTRAEVELMLVPVRKALRNKNVHAYMRFVVAYAQKPEPPQAVRGEAMQLS